jgi:hypothetical protein
MTDTMVCEQPGISALLAREKKKFRNLGQTFYRWYKADKVKFVYGTEARGLDMEIQRIAELIEYVKKKKEVVSPYR